MGFVLKTAPLAEALRLKLTVTERSLPEVLNHAGKNLALRAVQYTAAVSPMQISEELTRLVGHRIAGKSGRRYKKPRPIVKPTTLARNIVLARLFKKGIDIHSVSPDEIDQMVDRLVKSRRASVNFLKAGWLPAARLFGANIGSIATFGPDHGTGKLATVDNLFALLENSVPTEWKAGAPAYLEAQRALQQAVDFVEADVLLYTDAKLGAAGFTR